jgi:hypothetical protein
MLATKERTEQYAVESQGQGERASRFERRFAAKVIRNE